MNSQVAIETRFIIKALPTLRTFVTLFICMNSLVGI
uniref:Uncharacterized protein n=1 Tax=Anguilla anguilla TaxID=7936 RepID=A0A0E9XWM0_ANGAN